MPGPTCMTQQQMGSYLNDLRTQRVQRPNGSRPPPIGSITRHSTIRSTSITSAPAHYFSPIKVPSTYGSVNSRRSVRISSARSRRTVSGQSAISDEGLEDLISQPVRYTDDPGREIERQEAHEVRLALEKLDLRAEQRYSDTYPSDEGSVAGRLRDEELRKYLQKPVGQVGDEMRAAGYNMQAGRRTPSDNAQLELAEDALYENTNPDLFGIDNKHMGFQDTTEQPPPSRSNIPETGQLLRINKQRPISDARLPNFSLFGVNSRRRSSGARRVSSGQQKRLFSNPDDKIYEDPAENLWANSDSIPETETSGRSRAIPQTNESKHSPLLPTEAQRSAEQRQQPHHELQQIGENPAYVHRNPFARVRTLKTKLSSGGSLRQKGMVVETVEAKQISLHSSRCPNSTTAHVRGTITGNPFTSSHTVETPRGAPAVVMTASSAEEQRSLSHLGTTTAAPVTPPNGDYWDTLQTASDSTKALVPQPLKLSRSRSNLYPSPVIQPSQQRPPVPMIVLPETEHRTDGTQCNSNGRPLPLPHNDRCQATNPQIPQISITSDIPSITVHESPTYSDDISITKFPLPPSNTMPRSSHSHSNQPASQIPSFTFDLVKSEEEIVSAVGPGSAYQARAAPHPTQPQMSHHPSTPRSSGDLCSTCALPIAGRALTASSARFHPKCFTCHHCHTALECVGFYPEPEKHRAARLDHFHSQQSQDEFMMEEDEEVHRRMSDQEGVEGDGDESLRFYCHLDYHELFSPRCKSCKTPIEGEIITACGAEWHPGHFFCAQCGDPFEADTAFVEREGYAWCLDCHLSRFSPKCKSCRKPITGDDGVNALGSQWHEKCFCCMECGGLFEDGGFFVKEGTDTHVCLKCEARKLKAWM